MFSSLKDYKDFLHFIEMYAGKERMMHVQRMIEIMAQTATPVDLAPQKKCPYPIQTDVGNKGNKPMCYDCDCDSDYSPEARKTSYLVDALYAIREDKINDLRKKFNMDEDKPKTVEDFIERVKAGKFQIHSKEYQADRRWWNPQDFLIWREPGVEPDQDGFNKAVAAMDVESEAAKIRIRVLTPAEGLAALDAFKAWTYSG